MIRTETDQTVTLRRPDPDTGDIVAVDVTVPAGAHEKGDDADFNAALEFLFTAHVADDDERPHEVEVTDIVTREPVAIPRRKSKTEPVVDTTTTPEV